MEFGEERPTIDRDICNLSVEEGYTKSKENVDIRLVGLDRYEGIAKRNCLNTLASFGSREKDGPFERKTFPRDNSFH